MASPERWYLWVADGLLVVHASFVAFVVLGFAAILLGIVLHWDWTTRPGFRITHLLAIGFVVLQAWFGRVCPLTVWEAELRRRAGVPTYESTFVEYWLQRLIFYEAEPWVFVVAYTGFGFAVLLTFVLAPPRRSRPD